MNIELFYSSIANNFQWLGVLGKLTTLVIVALVIQKPFKKRDEMIMALIAFQFVSISSMFFIASSTSLIPKSQLMNLTFILLIVGSILQAICFGISIFMPEGRWKFFNENEGLKYLGYGAVILGFFYPFFSDPIYDAILFSPVTLIPHPTMLIISGLAILSCPDTPRLPMGALAFGNILIAVIDVSNGVNSSIVLGIVGLVMAGIMIKSAVAAGGILEDDHPRIDVRRKEQRKAIIKEKTSPQKTWKLK